MADETFGVSIVEAQASGLPVVGVAAGAMVDRVTPDVGLLGPVDDADAMADNILAVWNSDHRAMGDAAAEHARQYSWDRSMTELFTTVYPRAFGRAWKRATEGGMGSIPALADA
jgi:alpha-1,6-mannosyltransferase